MMEALFVAIGGFLGAISRYALSKNIQNRNKTDFPFGTLIVNLIGAFLLGLLIGMQVSGHLYSLFGIGFMGAFTTFSTFKLEANQLKSSKKHKHFFSYLTCSYVFGIILTFCGILIGKLV